MIKSIEVHGLPRQQVPLKADLNADLNIITGRNGSGKTTLLKLLWYVISGNMQQALLEIPFEKVMIETTDYKITVDKLNPYTCEVEFERDGERYIFEDIHDDDPDVRQDAEVMANEAVVGIGTSLFFPTFRRIEGGFSIGRRPSALPFRPSNPRGSEIEDALQALSRRLSHKDHTFVSAISTGDIVQLLMRQYTELSELSNSKQKEVSQEIIDRIKSFEGSSTVKREQDNSKADEVLSAIKTMVVNMEKSRKNIMAPLDAVREVVESLFIHSGIMLGNRLSFGDAANAVNSDLLSAGEKQMLSFICYNAFHSNSVIFIDEPELSLHVDWQRQLFPTLQEQQTSNQFIIATHSPFIYSKYPDKEVSMNPDRGDTGNDQVVADID